jgi:hypothetical protein
LSATSTEGLLAALESAGAAVPSEAPAPAAAPEPAQAPATPSTDTPTPAPPTIPTTPPTEPTAPPPKTPEEIEREVASRYERQLNGYKGALQKQSNETKAAREALAAREQAIDTDLARLRDAQPNQQARDYYQAALDQRAIARERQSIEAEKAEIAAFRQTFQQSQQQAQEAVLRTEAETILPGYLDQALKARGLPPEAGAEIRQILELPANQSFLKTAPLDGALPWIKSMGDYIDQQIPALQTKWTASNRGAARSDGTFWRPDGGSAGTASAAPKTMADTSGNGLADFIANFNG